MSILDTGYAYWGRPLVAPVLLGAVLSLMHPLLPEEFPNARDQKKASETFFHKFGIQTVAKPGSENCADTACSNGRNNLI